MDLVNTINEILQREKSVLAVLILDKDGIVVAEQGKQEMNKAQELAVEYASAMHQILKVTDVLEVGNLEEVVISTEKSVIVIRLITRSYFLIVISETSGNTGKAKYLARLVSEKLQKEFV